MRAGDHETVPGTAEQGVVDEQQHIGWLRAEAKPVRAEGAVQLARRDIGCDEDPVTTEEGAALRYDWFHDHDDPH